MLYTNGELSYSEPQNKAALHSHSWPLLALGRSLTAGQRMTWAHCEQRVKGKAERGAGLPMPTSSFHIVQPDKALRCHRGASESRRRDKAYYANGCPSAWKETPPQVHCRSLVSLGVGCLLVRCPPQSR